MNDGRGNDLWSTEALATPERLPEPEAPPEKEGEVLATSHPGRRSRGWLWLLPGLIFAAACVFLRLQNQAAAATVEALTTRAPQMLLPAGVPNPLAAQLDAVRQAAEGHNFFAAAQRAGALALPLGQRQQPLPGAVGGPGAAPAPEITPQMAAFFHEHPELEARLGQYSDLARSARDAGKEVQPLRDLRDRILQAAQRGDSLQVSALLEEFAQDLRAVGVDPEQAPAGMQALMGEFQQAFDQARREGRDPTRAVGLIKQAQQEAEAGHRDQAVALAKQALETLKTAPRATGARRVPQPQPMPTGPPPTMAQQILGMTFNLMGVEEQDLRQTYNSVGEASLAVREQNPDQVREILAQARESLERIRNRRQAFSTELNRLAAGKEAAPAATAPAPSPDLKNAVESIAALLDETRKLSVEDYQQVRPSLARETLRILLSMGPPAPSAPQAGQPRTAEEQAAAQKAEARIREKLQLAQGPYQKMKGAGEDVSELATILGEARQALYAGDLARAEDRVDEALRELKILPDASP